MYKDPSSGKSFDSIIALCHEFNVKLNLTTNGSFHSPLGYSVEQWARLIVPVTTDVKFSWNGMSSEVQEQIMRGSKLHKQVSGHSCLRWALSSYEQRCVLFHSIGCKPQNVPEYS